MNLPTRAQATGNTDTLRAIEDIDLSELAQIEVKQIAVISSYQPGQPFDDPTHAVDIIQPNQFSLA